MTKEAIKDIQRYKQLEEEMDLDKDTKHLTRREAIEYIESF